MRKYCFQVHFFLSSEFVPEKNKGRKAYITKTVHSPTNLLGSLGVQFD